MKETEILRGLGKARAAFQANKLAGGFVPGASDIVKGIADEWVKNGSDLRDVGGLKAWRDTTGGQQAFSKIDEIGQQALAKARTTLPPIESRTPYALSMGAKLGTGLGMLMHSPELAPGTFPANQPRPAPMPEFNNPAQPQPSPVSMARGGIVRGPGTSTSDSIPAMLSKGEAVLPAKTVRKVGAKNIARLIEQTNHKAPKRSLKSGLHAAVGYVPGPTSYVAPSLEQGAADVVAQTRARTAAVAAPAPAPAAPANTTYSPAATAAADQRALDSLQKQQRANLRTARADLRATTAAPTAQPIVEPAPVTPKPVAPAAAPAAPAAAPVTAGGPTLTEAATQPQSRVEAVKARVGAIKDAALGKPTAGAAPAAGGTAPATPPKPVKLTQTPEYKQKRAGFNTIANALSAGDDIGMVLSHPTAGAMEKIAGTAEALGNTAGGYLLDKLAGGRGAKAGLLAGFGNAATGFRPATAVAGAVREMIPESLGGGDSRTTLDDLRASHPGAGAGSDAGPVTAAVDAAKWYAGKVVPQSVRDKVAASAGNAEVKQAPAAAAPAAAPAPAAEAAPQPQQPARDPNVDSFGYPAVQMPTMLGGVGGSGNTLTYGAQRVGQGSGHAGFSYEPRTPAEKRFETVKVPVGKDADGNPIYQDRTQMSPEYAQEFHANQAESGGHLTPNQTGYYEQEIAPKLGGQKRKYFNGIEGVTQLADMAAHSRDLKRADSMYKEMVGQQTLRRGQDANFATTMVQRDLAQRQYQRDLFNDAATRNASLMENLSVGKDPKTGANVKDPGVYADNMRQLTAALANARHPQTGQPLRLGDLDNSAIDAFLNAKDRKSFFDEKNGSVWRRMLRVAGVDGPAYQDNNPMGAAYTVTGTERGLGGQAQAVTPYGNTGVWYGDMAGNSLGSPVNVPQQQSMRDAWNAYNEGRR